MALGRLRQPEYTGQNRCTPCTVVNLAITGGLALVGALIEVWLAVPIIAGGLAAIYLRGYLVPGTPQLTKRYLPARVLAWFEQTPESAPLETNQLEPETVLCEHGLAEPAGADLRLTESTRGELREHIEHYRAGPTGEQVAAFVGHPEAALEWTETDQGPVIARIDGRIVGRWESRGALIADLAGADVLETALPNWDSIAIAERARLANGLRALLESCPICEGAVSLGERTVESCCRERQVYALECAACGARLLEVRQ